MLVTGAPYEAALAAAPASAPVRRSSATIVTHTSGTTGRPKGAERDLTPEAVGAFVGFLERVPLHRDHELCIPAPLFHAFAQGLMGVALAMGTTMVLPARFDAAALLATIAAREVRAVALVPVRLRRLLEVPDAPPTPSWRIGIVSGSALPRALRAAAEERFGPIFYDLYGSTEVGWAAIATPADHARRPGTVGRPGHGVRIAVLDEDGHEVGAGTIGRIVVTSGLAYRGYTGSARRGTGQGWTRVISATSTRTATSTSPGEPTTWSYRAGRTSTRARSRRSSTPIPTCGRPRSSASRTRSTARCSTPTSCRAPAPSCPSRTSSHARAQLSRYKVPKRVVVRSSLPRNAAGKVLTSAL